MSTHAHLNAGHYRPDIDGLRALAVIAVIIFHAFPSSLKGGFVGVDVFFVISGYLISGILYRQFEGGHFSLAGFYARRIRRIFPALAVVMLACLAFGYVALLADEYKQLGTHAAAGAAFISNLVLWQEAGYFDTTSESKPFLHLWSLGVEEQFYLLWPLLLYACYRMRRNPWGIIVAVGLVSFTANLISLGHDRVFMFYSPLTRFWELVFGAALAYGHHHPKPLLSSFKWRPGYRHAASWVGLALIVGCAFGLNKKVPFPSGYGLMPVIGACLIIAAGMRAHVNRWLLANRVMVGVGLISFPLYLWHWPLLSFARIIYSSEPPVSVRAACVLLAFMLAALTYRFIEKPLRFGSALRAKTIGLCVAMAVIGIGGLFIARSEGLPNRASITGFANNKNELVRTPASDDACKKQTGQAKVLFHYCRYRDASAKQTVALIGDSHAHVAFAGMAEALALRGFYTLLLANSNCPPLLGTVTGSLEGEQKACAASIQQIIDVLSTTPAITHVFIATRGPIYTTGDGFGEAEKNHRKQPIRAQQREWQELSPTALFARGLEATASTLRKAGKKTYYILDNPELGVTITQCIARPLRTNVRDCSIPRVTVEARNAAYRSAVKSIAGLTVIDSLPAFCPHDHCLAFDGNQLLYADDNHLSLAGSHFLAKHVLARHLPGVAPSAPIKN